MRPLKPAQESAGYKGRQEERLHAFGEADHVPFRIGEERDRDHRQLGYRQNRASPELLGLVESGLRIVGADIEGDVPVAVGRLADPPPMPSPSFSTIAYGISPG